MCASEIRRLQHAACGSFATHLTTMSCSLMARSRASALLTSRSMGVAWS